MHQNGYTLLYQLISVAILKRLVLDVVKIIVTILAQIWMALPSWKEDCDNY